MTLFFPVLPHYAALLRRLFSMRVVRRTRRGRFISMKQRRDPDLSQSPRPRERRCMADILEAMLLRASDAFATDDRKRVGAARQMGDAIKAYLSGLDTDANSDSDLRRIEEIAVFTINLESAGDVVDGNLLDHAATYA
jgi:phosphate:Na+ symporter